MAKFIEINQVCRISRRIHGEDGYDYVDQPIYINTDLIETIIPQGETCIIRMTSGGDTITANHSALWVIGLINGGI